MSPGTQAGIAVSVLGIAAIVIGCTIIWLRRRRRALQRSLHCEIYPQPDDKFNPASKFASGLNTIAEIFKHPSKERTPFSTMDAGSGTYFVNKTQGGYRTSYTVQLWKNRALNCADWTCSATSTALQNLLEKLHTVTKRNTPLSDTHSRHSHGYIFTQEFQHLPLSPPPLLPQPRQTRVQKIVTRLYSRRGPTIKPAGDSFRPSVTDPAALTWSSMSSRNMSRIEYDPPQLPPPCKISDELGRDLVKMRSVSSGTVALNDTTAITVDALAGHISCENLSSQQRQRQRQRSIRSNSSTPSSCSPRQVKVPPVKLWTTQIFRVEMDFSPAPLPAPYCDRQLAVREGQMVRLEQIFDDGWALCTLLETETQQGLLPRACLSTWPIKERRHHTPSSTYSAPYTSPERGPSSAVVSPTESQSIRFYRRASPPSMTKPSDSESMPSNATKQSISPSLSTVFRV